MNTVTKANVLYAPVVDARDVVMSYLVGGVLIGEWWPTLTICARAFNEMAVNWRDESLAELGARVSVIAYGRLGDRCQVAEVSDHLAVMLDDINQVLGIRPDRGARATIPSGVESSRMVYDGPEQSSTNVGGQSPRLSAIPVPPPLDVRDDGPGAWTVGPHGGFLF